MFYRHSPIERAELIMIRIFRDRAVYKDEFMKAGLKVCERVSSMPSRTFEALMNGTGAGIYKDNKWDIEAWDLYMAFVDAERIRAPYSIIKNKALVDHYHIDRKNMYYACINAESDYTLINLCYSCNKFYKFSFDLLYVLDSDRYRVDDCDKCNKELEVIYEKQNELRKLKKLVNQLKRAKQDD